MIISIWLNPNFAPVIDMNFVQRCIGRALREWTYLLLPYLKRFYTLTQGKGSLVIGGTGAASFFEKRYGFNPMSANLTVAPTSISYMFGILKNYHSYLKKNGNVIILVHPFSLCIKHYNKNAVIADDIRFYPILHNALIENFNNDLSEKWSRIFVPKSFHDIINRCKLIKRYTIKDEADECVAVMQGNIDPQGHISDYLRNIVDNNVSVLKAMKDFADERGYNFKIIIMRELFSGMSIEKYDEIIDEILDIPLNNMDLLCTKTENENI